MNYIRYLKSFLFLFLLICAPLHALQLPQGNDQLSDQEQMMLKELNNMSEEQQMEMWNAIVAEVEKEAQKMPESEREQFLNSFWSEVAQEAEKLEKKIQNTPGILQPTPEPQKEPEIAQPKKVETPKPQPVQPTKPTSDKGEALKKTIEGILSRLSSFMTKTAIIPDMPTRIIELKKQGFLANIPDQFSWATFKRDIEKFTQQLHTLLDKDPKTKQPKYLTSVDESLRNNLNQLHTKLATYEPKIETTDFAQTRLGKESKNAFNFVVNALTESFYVLSLLPELDKVFGTYEPRRQELIKQKEALETSAAKPSAPTTVRPISQAGFAAPDLAGSAPAPYKYPTASGSFDYGQPMGGFERSASAGAPSFGPEPTPAPSGMGGKSPKAAAPDLKAPPAPSDKAPKPDTKGSRQMPSAKPEELKKDKKEDEDKKKDKKGDDTLKELYKMVRESLFNLQEALSNRFMKDLAQHILSNVQVNLRTVQAAEAATKSALTAANRVSQWRLRIKRAEEAIAKSSQEDAEDLLELYGKTIQTMLEQIKYIKSQEEKISADKKYAFIDPNTIPETQTLPTTLPLPTSVYELGDALNELLINLRNASAGK